MRRGWWVWSSSFGTTATSPAQTRRSSIRSNWEKNYGFLLKLLAAGGRGIKKSQQVPRIPFSCLWNAGCKSSKNETRVHSRENVTRQRYLPHPPHLIQPMSTPRQALTFRVTHGDFSVTIVHPSVHTLEDLAESIIRSVYFDMDHCFGFYSNLENVSCATTIKAGRRRQLKLPSWEGGFSG